MHLMIKSLARTLQALRLSGDLTPLSSIRHWGLLECPAPQPPSWSPAHGDPSPAMPARNNRRVALALCLTATMCKASAQEQLGVQAHKQQVQILPIG